MPCAGRFGLGRDRIVGAEPASRELSSDLPDHGDSAANVACHRRPSAGLDPPEAIADAFRYPCSPARAEHFWPRR